MDESEMKGSSSGKFLTLLILSGRASQLALVVKNPPASAGEYTEELYRKDLHDPDNHDGVITHLEPDVLECEVKWASKSITTNKANGGDEFHLSYFKF